MHFLDPLWAGFLTFLPFVVLFLSFVTAVVQAILATIDILRRRQQKEPIPSQNVSPSKPDLQPRFQLQSLSAQSQEIRSVAEGKNEANNGEDRLIQQNQQGR